jgi:predicted MFS family arabinose efflux permease
LTAEEKSNLTLLTIHPRKVDSDPTYPDDAMHFVHIYFAFAAAYLLSYLYRTVNAVISPELVRDLGLNPSSLGFLTSAYFLGFAVMQLPVGILLDRYGPRRVEPVLLVIAAAGAALFALSDTVAGFALARAIIGVGVCACLMAPLKAIVAWYPPDRQASYSGWIMVAGSVGALAATVPVELALRVAPWRALFGGLAVTTLACALFLYWRVPDIDKPERAEPLASQARAVGAVLVHARFWWIAPLGAVAAGGFMAIQGLWAVPWMMEVQGFARATAANYLLAMNAVMLAGYVALGTFGTRLTRLGVKPQHMFGYGFALNFAAMALIVSSVPGSLVWWSLYGLGSTVNVLGFTALNAGFARGLAGRTNTALNLAMFVGSFLVQWGIGVIADAARAGWGFDVGNGLRAAFVAVLALHALALVWFVRGFRRYGAAMAAT